MSNNSIAAEIGTKYEDYIDLIADNGEPGFIWLDVTRNWGRTIDPKDGKDYRIMGFNPCAEQPLESYELCTLVEVHLNRHEDKADFMRTLNLHIFTEKLLPCCLLTGNKQMQLCKEIVELEHLLLALRHLLTQGGFQS